MKPVWSPWHPAGLLDNEIDPDRFAGASARGYGPAYFRLFPGCWCRDQIALFDTAVRAVGALDEDEQDNPIAARMHSEQARLIAEGADEKLAKQRAGFRVFGSKPGAYGAGLQALMDENDWAKRDDLAEAWLVWAATPMGQAKKASQSVAFSKNDCGQ